MSSMTQQELLEPVGLGRLWYGVMIGAGAWKLQLLALYALVPYACWHGLPILIHMSSLAGFLLALSGGWVGWENWRRSGASIDTELGGTAGRSRFMGLAGMVIGPFFALVILGQWLPNLLLSPCDGIS